MKVLLLMYLCSGAGQTDCQVIPVQAWATPDAYQQCAALVPELSAALTETNRERTYFACELQDQGAGQALQAGSRFVHQTFRF